MNVRFLATAIALAFIAPIWPSAALSEMPPAKSGVDKLYVLDCADGEAPDNLIGRRARISANAWSFRTIAI